MAALLEINTIVCKSHSAFKFEIISFTVIFVTKSVLQHEISDKTAFVPITR